MKKYFLVICTTLLIVFSYGCQAAVQNEKIDEASIVTEETIEIDQIQSTVSKDEMIMTVLETVFTVRESDYNQNKIDFTFASEDRQDELEQYFSDDGFDRFLRSQGILGFIYVYGENICTSELEDIELEYRETSKVDELVCYYTFNHKLTFEDTAIGPFEEMVSGEMTLNNYDGEWKIDYYRISNYRSYQTSFSEHIEALDIENGKVVHTRDEVDNIINQILTDTSKLRLINNSKLNITTPEPYNIIVFEDSQIKFSSGYDEFDSVVYYDDVEYFKDESTLLFHINGVRKSSSDNSVVDADYYDKIIISESEIIYLHKYRSDTRVSIWWYDQE